MVSVLEVVASEVVVVISRFPAMSTISDVSRSQVMVGGGKPTATQLMVTSIPVIATIGSVDCVICGRAVMWSKCKRKDL